jgi:8-oxo-dGTP diphosphatase
MKISYVVGFMFSEDHQQVALIRKNKPAWQAGKLNGIGGKIESWDANPFDAMLREFEEEAGAVASWKHYGRMAGPDWEVECFAAVGDLSTLISKTDEKIVIIETLDNEQETIENLGWLIAAAIDFLEDGRPSFVEATYP